MNHLPNMNTHRIQYTLILTTVASVCLASFISGRPVPTHMKLKTTKHFYLTPQDVSPNTHLCFHNTSHEVIPIIFYTYNPYSLP